MPTSKRIVKNQDNDILIRKTFVLGSTSEVAKAICIELAKRGCQYFHLVSRNRDQNKELVKELTEEYGASITQQTTDLINDASVDLCKRPEVGDFDLYLITAGSLGQPELGSIDSLEALKITASNYTGLIPWLTAIVTPERMNQSSRLWIFSSVAADRGRPSNYIYGAAKSALTIFCEGLLHRSYGKRFSIRIIKAGFIATRMTVGKAPKALCVNPLVVARHLLRRPNHRGIEYMPWWWSLIMYIVRFMPSKVLSNL